MEAQAQNNEGGGSSSVPVRFTALGVEADASPTLSQLAKALAAAQGEIEAASKDTVNPHFGKKYADLASIWRACRVPLSKHGLAVIQRPRVLADGVIVETWLIHTSGEWMRDDLLIPLRERSAQGLGSAITYGRRYGLAAMVGVAPDEDDDGNAAQAENDHAQAGYRNGNGSSNGNGKTTRTEQLKERVAAQANPEDGTVAASPWERIKVACLQAGKDEKAIGGFVKGTTGKAKPSELTDADVLTVKEVLANAAKNDAAISAANQQQQSAPAAPQPPTGAPASTAPMSSPPKKKLEITDLGNKDVPF